MKTNVEVIDLYGTSICILKWKHAAGIGYAALECGWMDGSLPVTDEVVHGRHPVTPGFNQDYLLCVRKLPLACPEPSQPGVGQVGPSGLKDFQENGEPLRSPSFCLRAASGHP